MMSTDHIGALARARLTTACGLPLVRRFGRVAAVRGELLVAQGISGPVGAACVIEDGHAAEGPGIAAEIVGFEAGGLLLMPAAGARGISRGARVYVAAGAADPLVGPGPLGRVIDARGAPLDGGPPIGGGQSWPLQGRAINPLARARITEAFDCGVAGINAFATLGRGTRTGLFAGSGVGKTTLLGMMVRHAAADVVVLAMIGERSREIREFIEDHLGAARARSVIVATPADETALARVQGATRAAAIAEYFRAQGKLVLLVVDSLTRLAMAQRDIALSLGEPPASRGYPASVNGALAAYIERAGMGGEGEGSITALHTVLVEGDDHIGDPVADTARGVLDGHIVLSRRLAEAGLFPPIDVLASLSRLMPGLVDAEHRGLAARARGLLARRAEKQDIVDLGAYAPGRDALLDEALRRGPALDALVRQPAGVAVTRPQAVARLRAALGGPDNSGAEAGA
jgi:flagellum-specific ATP synthase